MMELVVTEKADVRCKHRGVVKISASQHFVTVSGTPVLILLDPAGKSIGGCPNVGANIKPCTASLPAERGWSKFVTIQGQPMALKPITGKTDGTPPGMVEYIVVDPAQNFVQVSQ